MRSFAVSRAKDGQVAFYALYVLDAQSHPIAADPDVWAAWYALPTNRIIRVSAAGGFQVVTLFLGTNWGTDADPVFFLTHISGGPRHGVEVRASNFLSAIENHNTALAVAKGT
jgi:hypothetical protein